jgi:hypothetical protein
MHPVSKHPAMKTYGHVVVKLHAILTTALDCDDELFAPWSPLPSGKETLKFIKLKTTWAQMDFWTR